MQRCTRLALAVFVCLSLPLSVRSSASPEEQAIGAVNPARVRPPASSSAQVAALSRPNHPLSPKPPSSQAASVDASSIVYIGQTFSSGGQLPQSIAVGDVNLDGNLDLIVANECDSSSSSCPSGNGSVGILLGNGDGTFQPPQTYPSGGQNALSIAVADVNGDGKPDVIVANECDGASNACPQANGTIGILLGNGDGTFQPPQTYSSGGQAPQAVAVGDFNGDHKLDLVVANECDSSSPACPQGNGVLGVLLGNGDGSFQPAQTYVSGGQSLVSVAVADLNNDGKLDLVVANQCATGAGNCPQSAGSVGVLLGNGDGFFRSVQTYPSGGQAAQAIGVSDLNGDGLPDLVVINQCDLSNSNCPEGNGVVATLLGNGDGTFQSPVTSPSMTQSAKVKLPWST